MGWSLYLAGWGWEIWDGLFVLLFGATSSPTTRRRCFNIKGPSRVLWHARQVLTLRDIDVRLSPSLTVYLHSSTSKVTHLLFDSPMTLRKQKWLNFSISLRCSRSQDTRGDLTCNQSTPCPSSRHSQWEECRLYLTWPLDSPRAGRQHTGGTRAMMRREPSHSQGCGPRQRQFQTLHHGIQRRGKGGGDLSDTA